MEIFRLVVKFNNEAGLGLDLLMQKAKTKRQVLVSHVVYRLTCPLGSVRPAAWRLVVPYYYYLPSMYVGT